MFLYFISLYVYIQFLLPAIVSSKSHFSDLLSFNICCSPFSFLRHPLLSLQRITIEQIRNDEWFKKNYVPVRLLEYEDVNLDDVNAAFDDDDGVSETFD